MSIYLEIIKLLRPNQWYKNLVIFLALIFSGNFLNPSMVFLTLKGLGVLILISSANYILNDIIDLKKDRLHPEKSHRPLASGKISKTLAVILWMFFLLGGTILAYNLSPSFFYAVLGIVLISAVYNFYFKNKLFLDIIAIASNFVLRAISGALIINVEISPWLILGVFFFALFLVTGKRFGELSYLSTPQHRSVLQYYSKNIVFSLFSVFMTVLIMSFALFSFSSKHPQLIWTLPLFVYIILRYYYLILSNNKIARSPENSVKDVPLVVSASLFLLLTLLILSFK